MREEDKVILYVVDELFENINNRYERMINRLDKTFKEIKKIKEYQKLKW